MESEPHSFIARNGRERTWNAAGVTEQPRKNASLGLLIGGIVAVVAFIFLVTGGELGGKKTVDGDQDLPPIATANPDN